MRNYFLLLLAFTSLIWCSGCKHRVETNALNGITSLAQLAGGEVTTDSIAIIDSMRQYSIPAKVSVKADFPTDGNFLVVNSIREWISEQLGGSFTGTPDNGKAMLTHYAQQALQDLNDCAKDFGAEDSALIEGMVFDTDIQIEKIHETDQYVTYSYYEQGYSGGAHGWRVAHGQTFRKSDGRRVGLDFFQNEELDNLASILKKELLKDFFENDTAEFRNSMYDYYTTLPLPEYPPYFTKDGVFFVYQLYEIAPYVVGMPSCKLSYSTIEPMLTLAGKELLHTRSIATK